MELARQEKLVIAGWAAAHLRQAKHAGHARIKNVSVIGKDGRVLRKISWVDLSTKIHELADIEFATIDGVCPPYIRCPQCDAFYPKQKGSMDGTRCKPCKTGNGQLFCDGFDGQHCPDYAESRPTDFSTPYVKKRNGRPWQCERCQIWQKTGYREPVFCAGTGRVPCRSLHRIGPKGRLDSTGKWRCGQCANAYRNFQKKVAAGKWTRTAESIGGKKTRSAQLSSIGKSRRARDRGDAKKLLARKKRYEEYIKGMEAAQ